MFIIGITGGTGAGKTTALREIEALGGYVVDCDELYHSQLENSAELKNELVKHFGEVLTDGEIDRKKLGEIVFRDESRLQELEGIAYQFLISELHRTIDTQREEGRKLFAIDAISLVESGLSDLCNLVVGIIAPPEIRIRRVMAREGISEQYARLRLEAQKPDSFFRQHCDIILENKEENSEKFGLLCRRIFSDIINETNFKPKEQKNGE